MLAPLGVYLTLGQRGYAVLGLVLVAVIVTVAIGVCIAVWFLWSWRCDASQKIKLQHEEERLCLQRFPANDVLPGPLAA